MKNNQKGLSFVILLVIVGVIALGLGFVFYTTNSNESPTTLNEPESPATEADNPADVTNNAETSTSEKTKFEYKGNLLDVSGDNASGTAEVTYLNNVFGDGYGLQATFENLPNLESGYFYEGWIVKRSPLDAISTGPTVIIEGKHTNNFKSNSDLTDHDFYVLTLEPDDGDPAPAEHILEGVLEEK